MEAATKIDRTLEFANKIQQLQPIRRYAQKFTVQKKLQRSAGA
jgi:hypothetical protein